MMKRKISWLLHLLCTSFAYSQEFAYEAAVMPVTESAYYKIILSSQLLGKMNPNKSDLRIYSEDGKEQPYLLRHELAISTTSLFKEYEILQKNFKEDSISYLIFHNPEKQAIDNVSFIVKNTDVQKRARLSGSDDQDDWFVIKDDYLLHAMHSSAATSELKILNFPLSDYAYFKLEIIDNQKLPINILKVGYYDNHKVNGNSTVFDLPIAYQKDSLKKSYLKLVLPEYMYLEGLTFVLSGADYYSRYTKVLVQRERVNRERNKEYYFETIGSLNLNSNSRNHLDIGGIVTKELYIEIDNKDDQPLIVEQVTGSFLNQYVVAELDEHATYKLKLGNADLRSPNYDIVAFADEISPAISQIKHMKIVSLTPALDMVMKEPGIIDNVYFIWLVIGLVGIVLGWISLKMIKEMGK